MNQQLEQEFDRTLRYIKFLANYYSSRYDFFSAVNGSITTLAILLGGSGKLLEDLDSSDEQPTD
jgi:hypothetical protein